MINFQNMALRSKSCCPNARTAEHDQIRATSICHIDNSSSDAAECGLEFSDVSHFVPNVL